MFARRLTASQPNFCCLLALIFLQLSLYGLMTEAINLPSELILDGVSLLQSVEYAQQQQKQQQLQQQQQHSKAHAHEHRQFPLVAAEVEDDVASDEAELPPIVASAVNAAEEYGARNTNGAADEQVANLAVNNGATEAHEHADDYDNMAAKLRQPPIWLQLHGEMSAPQQQQQDYEQPHQHQSTFVKLPHQHKHNTHKHAAPAIVSTTAAATLPPPPPPPPAQRHCAVEITTKLAGVCQPMTPIGSACIAGDYMDVYNLDCM